MKHSPPMPRGTDPALINQSKDALVVVTFGRSPSANYALAVSLARSARRYELREIGGKPVHVAVFGRDSLQAQRAAALLKVVEAWKGTILFAGGRALGWRDYPSLRIDCYARSFACRDPRAHCQFVDDGYNRTEGARHLSPCQFLRGVFYKVDPSLPSSPEDQVQALAVAEGCEWCPRFDSRNYRLITT